VARLRISLTLPGAVSLGAYEGGALAALLLACQELGEQAVVIDSMASASAGSITGLLSARALLRGADPIQMLSRAWVELVSLKAMKTHSTESPLSGAALSAIATAILGPEGIPDGPQDRRQREPIQLSMALANLAGLSYALPVVDRATPMQASTFLDWYSVKLTNDFDSGKYLELAQAAIASGANAIGFPPKQLDRSADRGQYVQDGLDGFPADGKFWYTDGGTVDNEPLGRTIDLAQSVGSDDDRVYLLIHPDPAATTNTPSPTWTGDSPQPSWLHAGTRAFTIGRIQTIFEDLKRLEKTNSYLEWTKAIPAAVQAGVNEAIEKLGLTVGQADTLRASLQEAAAAELGKIRQQQEQVRDAAGRAARGRGAVSGEYSETLQALVAAATGLEGKKPVSVDVVSPAIDPAVTEPASAQLAGAFLFHFGGFVDIKYRQSDFALGYRNMQYWLEHSLSRYLDGTDLTGALASVAEVYLQLGWDGIRHGGAQLGSLSAGERIELGEVAAHVLNVIRHDVV
jgi:predicted acylesterase/phospholipase RssA